MHKTTRIENTYLAKLQSGDEAGLTYFYTRFYREYAYRAYRYIREEAEAESIAQEAFLRLWIFRERITDVAHLHHFIQRQVREAGRAYFRLPSNRFWRRFLWLYDFDDTAQWVPNTSPVETLELEEPSAQQARQLEALNRLLPHLADDQQMFIRLCLKFDFNYERIAFYLGGIREYEVAQRVEKCIACLKSLLGNSQKLTEVARVQHLQVDRSISAEQAEILRLRYELGHSFEEIARQLGLPPKKINLLFIQAFTTLKKGHGKTNSHETNTIAYRMQG